MLLKIFNNDYSLNLINKVYTIFIGLISTAFLTRYLGIVYKGEYSYITQLISVFTIILNLGIHQSYPFFYKNNKGNMLKKYVDLYVLQFFLLLVLSVSLSMVLNNHLYIYVIISLPFSVINQQMESTMAIENIKIKIKLHMFNVTFRMICFVGMFLLIKQSLLAPVIVTILINIITVYVYVHFSGIKPQPQKNDIKFVKEVVNYSWIPMITALLITLNYSVDVFFLKHMSNSVELGLYSTALGIVNYFWLIPDSFKEVLVSRVAREHSLKSTLLVIKLSILSVIAMVIAFIIFGKFALNILFGSEFVNAYLVTLILSLGAINMIFYKMIGVVLLSEGKRWVYFFSLLISVVVNIVLNKITVPIYGMYGAAYSSVISYTLCGLIFLIYFVNDKKISISDVIFFKESEVSALKNIIKRS